MALLPILDALFVVYVFYAFSHLFIHELFMEPLLLETLKATSIEDKNGLSILGLFWEPEGDCFRIKINLRSFSDKELVTKRTILSQIARIFDPLGFVAPVTITAKLLMQDVWREELTWDQPVSELLFKKFRDYIDGLSFLLEFSVPRNNFGIVPISKKLLGFCDASQKAYCAVVYLRVEFSNGDILCILLCAKTRVAPLKAITIPRLELLGACLLSDLVSRVRKNYSLDVRDVFLFSDSMVVLSWLDNNPNLPLQVFVQNRVHKMNNIFPISHWHFVKTSENPADLGTRGISSRSLVDNQLWLYGQSWAIADFSSYCNNDIKPLTDVPELKPSVKLCVLTTYKCAFPFDNFSSYTRLINVIAYCRRPFLVKRSLKMYSTLQLYVEEREKALNVVIRYSQESFKKEIEAIRGQVPLPLRSSMVSLTPFLDSNGILRVGGRLAKSTFDFNVKHPIILPKKCNFLKLFVTFVHKKYFHAGNAFICNFVRRKFWVIGGLSQLVKNLTHNCVVCTRFRANFAQLIMGDLPPH